MQSILMTACLLICQTPDPPAPADPYGDPAAYGDPTTPPPTAGAATLRLGDAAGAADAPAPARNGEVAPPPYGGDPTPAPPYGGPGYGDAPAYGGGAGPVMPPASAPAPAPAPARGSLGAPPPAAALPPADPMLDAPREVAPSSAGGYASPGDYAPPRRSPAAAPPNHPSAVQPAQASQPAVQDAASRQLVGMLFAIENTPLQATGRPLPMQAVLDRHAGGNDRLQAIRAYWTVSRRWAELWSATEKVSQLEPLADGNSLMHAAYLEAAGAERARRLRLSEAQRDLARWMGLPESEALLPADPPLARTYATRFDEVFRGRYVSAEARHIHETLPAVHELTAVRGEALLAYMRARRETLEAVQQGRESPATAMTVLQLTDQAYAKFLDTLFHYNDRIARYAMEAGGEIDSSRAVAMLIHRPVASTLGNSVLQANATGPAGASGDGFQRRGSVAADQRPSLNYSR